MDPTAEPGPSPRRRLATVLGVLLLFVAVLGLLGTAGFALLERDEAVALKARLAPGWVAGAVGWWLVASVLAGPRLAGALPAADRAAAPSGWRMGSWMVGVHALNLALPGPAGDLAFIGLLVRRHRLALRTVVAATTWTRVLGLATIALLGLLVLPLAPAGGGLGAVLLVAVGLAGVGGVTLGAASLWPDALVALSRATVGRLTEARVVGPLAAGVHRGVSGLARGLADVAHAGPGLIARTVGWSLGVQAALATSLACAAKAIGVSMPLAPLAVVHVTAELSAVAVAVAPAGLGGFDAALAAAAVAFGGLAPVDAAVWVLCVRIVQVLALSLGALALASWAPALLEVAPPSPPSDADTVATFPEDTGK